MSQIHNKKIDIFFYWGVKVISINYKMFSPKEYYLRDQSMGLNGNKLLQSHLKMLDLVNFNINDRIESFIKSEMPIWIRCNYNSSLNSLSLGEIVEQIKESQKFKSYLEHLKKQETRAIVLGTCVYLDFYHLCTEEELVYLGW